MIIFYIRSQRLRLKREGLSDARIVPLTKTEYGFAIHLSIDSLNNNHIVTSTIISSMQSIFCRVLLDCVHQYIHIYLQYHSNIQQKF